jgi:hypothetical protein
MRTRAMWVVLFLASLFWWGVLSASAQEVRRLYPAYGGLVVADSALTYHLLSRGTHREGNPLASPCPTHATCTVTVTAAMAGATVWGVETLRKRHPKLAFWVLVGATAARGYAVVHNIRQVRR